jgi:protein-cysteine N-palmitoyltransferase HHAT
MTIISFFRDLYSLDTLDTRFTTSSTTPLKAGDDESRKTATQDGPSSSKLPSGASPPRWRTPEFLLYLLVFIVSVPQMYLAVVEVSQADSPNYTRYEHMLSPGWLFGRKVDNSDGQYAGFRDNLPYLALLVVLHPLARRGFEAVTDAASPSQANGPNKSGIASAAAQQRLRSRLTFDLLFALIYISALHGFSAVKILLILYLNFSLGTALPREYIPAATWIFNIAILFANEFSRGYSLAGLSEVLGPNFTTVGTWGKVLDSWGGLIPRWEVNFNITVLRLIAFNMDHFWALDRSSSGSPIEVRVNRADPLLLDDADSLKKKQLDPSSLSERDRVSIPAPGSSYTSFTTYVAYALYPPLYIAGPILTFNDYISQSTYVSPSISFRRTLLYAIRFLLTLFCMEFLLHTIYVVAISKASPDWSTYTPFQLSMLAYFNLHIIWLKLLLPWRFFRLWSLVDGIDPPENVVRCMSDNYSAQQFWRAWHRSYNRWIVRYIYIPLGGTGSGTSRVRGIANMLVVFTFVALWHDINLRLLAWGWLVVLFVLPEVLATMAFPRKKWESRPTTYRMLCGIGAVGNILMMMAANLVGFSVGLDGLKGLVAGIIGSWQGAVFMLAACGALFVGAQVMFEHREEEKRHGVKMKC